MTYNGWTNWETWNINLWIDNEEPTYREKVRFLRRTNTLFIDADIVERFCRDLFPDGTPDMDETDGGMNAVDWEEIAEHWRLEADDLS